MAAKKADAQPAYDPRNGCSAKRVPALAKLVPEETLVANHTKMDRLRKLWLRAADSLGMARPLRFVPPNAIVEVTTRTMQGRMLLRPSSELTDIILGVIGKAQDMYGMTIHAFVVLSTHAHYLLSPTNASQLASFMQFVNANIAKEAGKLHRWREKFWSRRYRSIVVADEKAAHARLRYIMSHGAKEGLVAKSGSWPGPNCIAALTTGKTLRGTWFDRSAEFMARKRAEKVPQSQFATSFEIDLTPLPCHAHMTAEQRRTEYRHMDKEIRAAAEAENAAKGRKAMGVAAILAQNPHSRPASTDRSPAPFVHATEKDTELSFRVQYRAFVDAFYAGVSQARDRARQLTAMFPLWAFPPALPFNKPA